MFKKDETANRFYSEKMIFQPDQTLGGKRVVQIFKENNTLLEAQQQKKKLKAPTHFVTKSNYTKKRKHDEIFHFSAEPALYYKRLIHSRRVCDSRMIFSRCGMNTAAVAAATTVLLIAAADLYARR